MLLFSLLDHHQLDCQNKVFPAVQCTMIVKGELQGWHILFILTRLYTVTSLWPFLNFDHCSSVMDWIVFSGPIHICGLQSQLVWVCMHLITPCKLILANCLSCYSKTMWFPRIKPSCLVQFNQRVLLSSCSRSMARRQTLKHYNNSTANWVNNVHFFLSLLHDSSCPIQFVPWEQQFWVYPNCYAR